ncbi:hypothetical protein LCGC14_1764720 [marine sediment metagenome]|uniref:Uncharacterized protein n=1 Tax=marine sediment metagenome TaxID=412755 RepID=A0A0F9GZZ3_9ZZZZ
MPHRSKVIAGKKGGRNLRRPSTSQLRSKSGRRQADALEAQRLRDVRAARRRAAEKKKR